MFYYKEARLIRKRNNIKLKELAKLLEISSNTLYRWETGISKPSSNDIRILAVLLRCSVQKISDFDEWSLPDIHASSEFGESNKLDILIKEYVDLPEKFILSIRKLISINKKYKKENTILAKKVNRYEQILNQSSTIVYVLDVNFKFRYVNHAFVLMFNQLTTEDIIGYKASDIFGLKDVYEMIQYEKKAFNVRDAVYDKKIFIPGSKKTKTGLLSIEPQIREDGSVYELICNIVDITEINNAMCKLENIKRLVELSEDIFILMKDDYSKYELVSKSFEKITGYSVDEMRNNTDFWKTYIHPEDYEKYFPIKNLTLNQKVTRKYRVVNKNGQTSWVEARKYFKFDQDSGCNLLYAVLRDISGSVEKDRILQILKNNLDVSKVGITLLDVSKGIIVYRNSVMTILTGYTVNAVNKVGINSFFEKNIHKDDIDKVLKLCNNKTSYLDCCTKFRFLRKDGKMRLLEMLAQNISYEKTIYQLRVHMDITDHPEHGKFI